MRLIDANALCEFFQERYEYLRNASEKQLPNGHVEVDLEIQCGAIIAKEFLDKAKNAPTINPDDLRPRGRWSETNWASHDGHDEVITHYEITALKCSNCCCCFKKEALWRKNYCPNCGAKMDGKENEDA